MLEIKGIHITYDRELFRSFDFSCTSHQITAISGESGTGKSTLLHIISQKITAYEQYLLDGKEITSNLLWHNLFYVEQDPVFEEDLTIREHLTLLYEYYQQPKDNRLEKELIEKLEIEHVFSLYPNMLSDGEKKRCAVFMACVSKRKILLFDEPTSAINEEMIQTMISVIQEYLKDSAVIISTHDQEVLAISDVIYTIRNEEIKQIGNVKGTEIKLIDHRKNADVLNYYWKSMKHQKGYHIIAQGLITFSICTLILGLFSVNVYVDQQKERLNALFSNQFIVYLPIVQGATYEQNEYPLTDDQLTKLKDIKSIQSIRELYCFTAINEKEIRKDNQAIFSKDDEVPINYISYDDTRDISAYIEDTFNDHGVYITQELAAKLGSIIYYIMLN